MGSWSNLVRISPLHGAGAGSNPAGPIWGYGVVWFSIRGLEPRDAGSNPANPMSMMKEQEGDLRYKRGKNCINEKIQEDAETYSA